MYIDLTTNYIGIISLIIFIIANLVVMIEEFTHLRKSKPVIISAALIWGLIAFYYSSKGIHNETLEQASLAEEKVLSLIKSFICVVKLNDPTGNH